MDLKQAFAASSVLRCATPASLAALAPTASLRRLRKGEHLFRERDPVETIYFVASGVVSLYKLNAAGEKRVIFALGADSLVNETICDDLAASAACEALEDSLLLCFDRRHFLLAMERDFRLTSAVFASLSKKVRRLYRQLKNASGALRGDKRIAAKLWKLARDHGTPCGEGLRIERRISVTYLAEMLGMQRESVSRQLKPLADAGLVASEEGSFRIPDPDALARYFKE